MLPKELDATSGAILDWIGLDWIVDNFGEMLVETVAD